MCQHALADAVAAAGGPAGPSDGAAPRADTLTPRALKALDSARASAGEREPRTVHLLGTVIGGEQNLARAVLSALDIEPDDVLDEARALLRRDPSSVGPMDDVVPRAVAEAERMGHNYVGTEHLLVALSDGPAEELVTMTLNRMGATPEALRIGVRTALAGWAHRPGDPHPQRVVRTDPRRARGHPAAPRPDREGLSSPASDHPSATPR